MTGQAMSGRHAFDAALREGGSQAYEKNTGRKGFEDKFSDLFGGLLDRDTGCIRPEFLQVRVCPCCGATSGFDTLFVKFQIPVVACAACAMVFATPCLSADGEHHMLESTSVWTDEHIRFLTSATYENFAKLRYRYELGVAARFCAPGSAGTHLDIGSGTGLMMEVAQEFGWTSYGVEPNEVSNRIAVGKGLRARHGWFPAENYGGRRFDLVTMIDVLEHIADLGSFLGEAAAAVTDGGHLFIQVPNLNSLCLQLCGADHHSNNGLFHVNYFSPATLKTVVERAGFEHLHTESILTEWSIIRQFSAAEIDTQLGRLAPGLRSTDLDADVILDHLIGYKLIAVFRKA